MNHVGLTIWMHTREQNKQVEHIHKMTDLDHKNHDTIAFLKALFVYTKMKLLRLKDDDFQLKVTNFYYMAVSRTLPYIQTRGTCTNAVRRFH